MRDAIAALGIEGRIGVESGEVVVGTHERLVTGRPVTSAARLEQAAQAGEILVGEGAIRLAGEAATAEPIEPLELKGKREPVPAWRLLLVSADAPTRRFDSPFVGRERELGTLDEGWARVCAEERCELVTVVGVAGVGKSRLVAEHVRRIDAAVAQGRCLSYGTGITYSSVVDIVLQLRSDMADPESAVSPPLRALLEDRGAASADELAWAFRKFVEASARERPLVLVFDDIQWAEEALLDLIEHVAFVSSGAPILLVCMARPELLERRAGWRGLMRLEPLTPQEAEQLISARFGGRPPDAARSQRIVAAADGNPLFVQELAAMLEESSDETIATPPTIQALLAARLDQLDPAERTVLEAAAVEGEVFHVDAVRALIPDEPLTAQLTALVRNEFVQPYRAEFEGEDGFRFRHLLLRDATYDAIPKAARSGLHESYADWLEQRGDRLDAFVGYHLEQAYRYRLDLRDTSLEADELAQRASMRLEAAATAALRRSDLTAAIGLLERASSLPPVSAGRRARLLTDLGSTLMDAGTLDEAERVLAEAEVLAAAAGDTCASARLLVERQFLDVHRASPGATDGVRAVIEQVIPILERAGDPHGLCRARQLEATADWTHGHVSAAAEAWECAAEHAATAGEEHQRAAILCWLASATWLGSMPVEDAVRRCEEIQDQVRGHPSSEAEILRRLGGLHGLAGRFDLARSLFAARNAAFEDLGIGLNYVFSTPEGVVELLAEDFAAAELGFRTSYDAYEAMGERAHRSTTAGFLARAILAQGRYEEAEQFSIISEELAEPDDLVTQIVWRGVRARVLTVRGEIEAAECLAREAVALAERTDLVNLHGDALLDLAAVLDADGRPAEAAEAGADALRLYEGKGNVVSAAATRERLDALAAI
jgi:predicted ATPase